MERKRCGSIEVECEICRWEISKAWYVFLISSTPDLYIPPLLTALFFGAGMTSGEVIFPVHRYRS